jgi:hypothetical protein
MNETRLLKIKEYNLALFVAARKSTHRFQSAMEETAALIDNYNPVFFTDGTFYKNYYFNFTSSM